MRCDPAPQKYSNPYYLYKMDVFSGHCWGDFFLSFLPGVGMLLRILNGGNRLSVHPCSGRRTLEVQCPEGIT